MPNPGWPTVQYGDEGDAVKQAQRALRRTPNTLLVVDGIFGSQTDTAARAFQSSRGLAVDGIVGSVTWLNLVN